VPEGRCVETLKVKTLKLMFAAAAAAAGRRPLLALRARLQHVAVLASEASPLLDSACIAGARVAVRLEQAKETGEKPPL
jgi:hypothetical protein